MFLNTLINNEIANYLIPPKGYLLIFDISKHKPGMHVINLRRIYDVLDLSFSMHLSVSKSVLFGVGLVGFFFSKRNSSLTAARNFKKFCKE